MREAGGSERRASWDVGQLQGKRIASKMSVTRVWPMDKILTQLARANYSILSLTHLVAAACDAKLLCLLLQRPGLLEVDVYDLHMEARAATSRFSAWSCKQLHAVSCNAAQCLGPHVRNVAAPTCGLVLSMGR